MLLLKYLAGLGGSVVFLVFLFSLHGENDFKILDSYLKLEIDFLLQRKVLIMLSNTFVIKA